MAKLSWFLDLGMVKNAPIMLIIGVSNSFGESISHVKYEQNRSIFEILGIDNFAICKNHLPNFLYVHI